MLYPASEFISVGIAECASGMGQVQSPAAKYGFDSGSFYWIENLVAFR
jgi:hypothetical protein